MVPPKELHIIVANENGEHVGLKLHTHICGDIGCNLATNSASFDEIFYKWIA